MGGPSDQSSRGEAREGRGNASDADGSIRSSSAAPTQSELLWDQAILQEITPMLLELISPGLFDSNIEYAEPGPSHDEKLATIRCGVILQAESRWITGFWIGDPWSPAHALVSEAIDQGDIVIDREFAAIAVPGHPIQDEGEPSDMPNMALVMSLGGRPASAELMTRMARILGQMFLLRRDRHDNTRRLWQLSSMLRAAAHWQQVDDDQALLESIAQCACEVLACERATIFLWDKPRHRLIGQPAIGIEGGVLEVDDDMGIVGEVLHSCVPRVWATGAVDDGRVNRLVDQAQRFQTHSLAAVPMLNSTSKIVGVFEVINAKPRGDFGGAFDAADVQTLAELAQHAVVAIDAQRNRLHLVRTCDRLITQAAESNPLIGNHASIRELRKQAAKVADTQLSVLILGQNGTGKEVLAQQIHYRSERRSGPFIAVNCAALVESLLESELFGHEKGAFTDASASRQGKFELAHNGTLFLDEIGDMSLAGQAKLLRVLEDRVVVRVGGSQPIPIDTRVIAATNQPLQELIAAKRFREDLFFRLNVVSLTLPPLSARGNDVILLAEHFLSFFCRQIGRVVPELDDSARRVMLSHPWPGNVRELRNTIERVSYLSSGNSIGEEDLLLSALRTSPPGPASTKTDKLELSLNEATREFQMMHIESVIAQCGGNMTKAAKRLGLHRSNLYRKMTQLEMTSSE